MKEVHVLPEGEVETAIMTVEQLSDCSFIGEVDLANHQKAFFMGFYEKDQYTCQFYRHVEGDDFGSFSARVRHNSFYAAKRACLEIASCDKEYKFFIFNTAVEMYKWLSE